MPNLSETRLSGVGLAACFTLALAACSGPQSALDPAGHDAERIAELFWVMAIAFSLIWVGVVAIALYAARQRAVPPQEGTANVLILGGGLVFPIIVLSVLLIYALDLMSALRSFGGG